MQKTIEALGGRLSLVAEFTDIEPVILVGFQGLRTER